MYYLLQIPTTLQDRYRKKKFPPPETNESKKIKVYWHKNEHRIEVSKAWQRIMEIFHVSGTNINALFPSEFTTCCARVQFETHMVSPNPIYYPVPPYCHLITVISCIEDMGSSIITVRQVRHVMGSLSPNRNKQASP